MHEIQAGRNCIARIEVISHSTAHVHSKREVLSLRIEHSLRALRVNVPHTEAYIKVGRNLPPARDKITPNPHEIREIAALRSPRNPGSRPGEGKVEISAQNPRPPWAAQMPSQRSKDGHQRIFQRVGVVGIAYENVKRKGDIDGMPS